LFSFFFTVCQFINTEQDVRVVNSDLVFCLWLSFSFSFLSKQHSYDWGFEIPSLFLSEYWTQNFNSYSPIARGFYGIFQLYFPDIINYNDLGLSKAKGKL